MDKNYLTQQFKNLEGYLREYSELDERNLLLLTSIYSVFNFTPTSSNDYTQLSAPNGTIIYVGSDITGASEITVPPDATKLEIQPVNADLRMCISENSLASDSNGQIYSSGHSPRTILLNSKHRISIYSSGIVSIQWGY